MFSVSKRPTIDEIHELYRSQKATPTQVTQFFLNRSKQINKNIHSINTHTESIAQQQSEMLDQEYQQALATGVETWFEDLITQKPLFGIPFSSKSLISVEGEVCNAASKILDGFKAAYSATCYQKCIDAGAVLIGIAEMDEFAMGSSGENSAYQRTQNPFDHESVVGGSSSGPVGSVASGQVVMSLGSDTGGSIRQPAAFTDVVGLKPTYGLVSRYGVMAMASSLDQVGPITNTVRDAKVLTGVLAGKDEKDQTTVNSDELKKELLKKVSTTTNKKLKIGIPEEFYGDGINTIIADAMEGIKAKLTAQGHTLVPISLPMTKHAVSVYYMLMTVEVSANQERYDGVRFRGSNTIDIPEPYEGYRDSFYGEEVKRRILLGTYASSAGYYDAYYNHANKVRELARREFAKAFEQVDVLLTPTTPEFPFKAGEKTDDPLTMYLSDIYTCGINPVRIPGLVVPLGLFDVQRGEETVSLPTGCQLLGPELSEDILFELGAEIETLVKSK